MLEAEREGRASDDRPAPAARVRGVGHRFAGGVEALSGVDLELAPGAICAVVGANGSGKTTLLRVLAGILPPGEGRVELLGIDSPAASSGRLRAALRRRVAYVRQAAALDPELTGRETLHLMAALHGLSRRRRTARAAELGAAFGIEEVLDRRVGSWSGGERRRLHLAAGLVHEPELVLLDEPSAGLDDQGRGALWAALAAAASDGAAVAVVTHDLPAAERHAARVTILERGRVAASGSPAELAAAHGGAEPGLAAVYRAVTGRDPRALAPPPGESSLPGGR